jgi:hypothetical protein
MLTKYTNCEVIEVKSADEKLEGNAKLSSFDHIPKDTYRTHDGYIYVKVRAISSRVNKNFDGWPVNELAGMDEGEFRRVASELNKHSSTNSRLTFTKDSSNLKSKGDYGFKTFIGRPIFVDHNNSDPTRSRGVIVDAMLHIEHPQKIASDSYWGGAPDNHKPETWIELLLEVDGKSFPKLAKSLLDGKVNAVSMGCNVEYTTCSICNHKAANVEEYCDHIKKKGTTYKTGNVSKVAYEDCYNVNFFEISAVFDPADVTALFTEPVIKQAASDFFDMNKDKFQPPVTNEEKEYLSDRINSWEEIIQYNNSFRSISSGEDFEKWISNLSETLKHWSDIFVNKYNDTSIEKLFENVKYIEILLNMPVSEDPEEEQQNSNLLNHAIDGYQNSLAEYEQRYMQSAAVYKNMSLNRMQETYDKSLSQEDYDMLMDAGIDPQSLVRDIDPRTDNRTSSSLKEASNETKEVEKNISKSASLEKEGYGNSITAPNKVDTLKSEKPCPIGLAGECGLDDESGRCEKCGYREPPKPLDDPDLSKAKEFDRIKEDQKDDSRNETKSLIDQLKRTLSRNEKRSVNSKMSEIRTNITLTANVDGVPSDSKLAELGWIIPEKEAGAASSTVSVIEDGQPASDRPKEQRVISDQTKPVESTTKSAMGGKPGLTQPNGGQSAPQFSGDKNNESSGINEHQPAETAEQYQKVKHPVEKPQFADEGDTKDIKQHNPSATTEQYESVKKVVEKPQFSDEGGTDGISQHQPGKKSHQESSILSAIKLADLEVELGLNDTEMKYARVAELENEDPTIVTAKYETLVKIKEAGLGKKEASNKKLASFPSLRGAKESSTSTSVNVVPDDAIFN